MPSSLVVTLGLLVSAAAPAAEPALEERVESSAWSDASWRADLDAAAALARHTHPRAAERLASLDGLQPEKYLMRRRAEPEVARELSRLVASGEVPAALLAELLVKGHERYPFAAADRYAKKPGADVQRLMRMEREQLDSGLLLALGGSAHPSGFFAIRGVLLDDKRPEPLRRVAAVALGKTKDARAVELLSTLARADKAPLDLKAAALAGLGNVRSLAAASALSELARQPTDAALLRATALALGSVASRSALASHDPSAADALGREATAPLVELLVSASDPKVAAASTEALSMVAHPSAKPLLQAIIDDERRPGQVRERAGVASRRLDRVLRRAPR